MNNSSDAELMRNNSSGKKVTIHLVLPSRDLPALEQETLTSSIILALLFFIAISSNLSIIITFLSSYSLRRMTFNFVILNLSLCCLVECIFNMLLAVYYVTRTVWTLGITLCSVNAFFTCLSSIEFSFAIFFMCFQRWAALWTPLSFKRVLTRKKQTVAIVTLWAIGVALSLPILAGVIEVKVFPGRYSCSMADDEWLTYYLVLTICCYAVPLFISLICLVYLIVQNIQENRIAKRQRRNQSYTDLFFQQSFLWNEWVSTKLISIIVVLYLVCEIPFIFVQQRGQLCKCYNNTDLVLSTNVTKPLEVVTSDVDITVTWFRYIFPLLVPLVIYWQRKDFRRKFTAMFCFCKKGAVGEISARPIKNKKLKTEASNKVKKNKEKVRDPTNLATPVLYATPEGLHLRLLDLTSETKKRVRLDHTIGSNWTVEPHFISYLCDTTWEDEGVEDAMEDEIDSTSPLTERRSSGSDISLDMFEDAEEHPIAPRDIAILSSIADTTICHKKPCKTTKSVRFADTITIFRPFTPKMKAVVKQPHSRVSCKVIGQESSNLKRRVNVKKKVVATDASTRRHQTVKKTTTKIPKAPPPWRS
ncbi:uncharacterized protein LOC143223668 [Tachypleus tridentatus]|uniref:uncharacterized protein LOC143223668 n=1 Tax=Tachypleus tridentatus TaxID=6853 RepID=UPI003FD4D1EF